MKILHTSDWHLGQKFISKEREEEHRLALRWLLEVIGTHKIDVLIVSGDIFDYGNPPNYSRKLYYNFLTDLIKTNCRHVVLIGGNHDSPAMLNAPKELLEALNINIIGSATEAIDDELILLKDEKGRVEAVVAAVPFLRDRDLKKSISGETEMERSEKIKSGIFNHYKVLGEAAAKYAAKGIPVIATGHLYAKGAIASGKQDNIYLGNLENIEAKAFPEVFDYVALGHIHRPQVVGKDKRIQYSGSLIPVSFSEIKDEKVVKIVEFDEKKKMTVEALAVPVFRRLKTVKGSLEEVQKKLENLHEKYKTQLTPWVEVIVESEKNIPDLSNLLRDFTEKMNIDLLKIRCTAQQYDLAIDEADQVELSELDPLQVFHRKLDAQKLPQKDAKAVENAFKELLENLDSE